MPTDDTLDCGEPDTRAFERLLRVQALKNTKQFIHVFHIKPDSVVFNKHDSFIGAVV
jgi:hypothetical protein